MKRETAKRVLALLICVLMTASMLPTVAMAEEVTDDAIDNSTETYATYENEDDSNVAALDGEDDSGSSGIPIEDEKPNTDIKIIPSDANALVLMDTGAQSPKGVPGQVVKLVLPLAVMVASHLWYYAYMIRNKLLDEVRRDYVLLARSKGLGRTRVLWSHCLRNVMPTVVGIMAISIPHVLSGTYVAEAVFNYPGIGLLAISSAKYHDYNLLMLMVLFTGAMVISSSLLAQSINEAIDPRIKSGEVVC